MERYNLGTVPDLGELRLPPPLTLSEFRAEMGKGAMVIDTSHPVAFGGAHIKGALSIWLAGLPGFAGWLLSYDRPVLLVLEEPSHLDTAVRYLARIGYDGVAGYLRGGIEGWANAGLPVETLPMLSVRELKDRLDRGEPLTVLDVRGRDEWQSGHLAESVSIYVGHLAERLSEIPEDRPVAVMCSVGHRATVGASLLLRAGYRQVVSVLGSFVAWKAAGFPVVRDG
jgi:hydroxyacylglutathione hydrolase